MAKTTREPIRGVGLMCALPPHKTDKRWCNRRDQAQAMGYTGASFGFSK